MLFCFKQSRLHAAKNEFTRKQSQMAIRQSLVTEWRAKVAHGETVGKATKPMKPRMGRKKFTLVIFCRPCLPLRSETKAGRGLNFFGQANPRFHRGLLSGPPPALGQAGFESHANGRKMFEPVSSVYPTSIPNAFLTMEAEAPKNF